MLLEELKLHKAIARYVEPDDLVFPTSKGTPLHRANVSNRILSKAIEAANARLVATGKPPIQDGVTNHLLSRQTKTPPKRGFSRLRGKDSNLDYLIQSQASYH
jgi:hypothetical protein